MHPAPDPVTPAAPDADPSREQVFAVLRHHVRPGRQADYEGWLRRVSEVASHSPGHLGVQVNRPHGAGRDYTIVLRFASARHAEAWLDSPTRAALVAEVRPWLEAEEQIEQHEGIAFWFTPTAAAAAVRWKQWLVTTLVIWPLTLLVPWALGPLLRPLGLPHPLAQGLVVMVIVALVVYVIMPRVTRALAPWLLRRH